MIETVLSFLDALNSEDFAKARSYLADDMKFIGVLGTREGADVYISDMEKMKFKYRIVKSFVEGSDVALFYDIDMDGTSVFAAGWYELENAKIKQFRVLFDPRPVMK
ncbi:nuclear transport factor 2 family protein [uncultured Chitinophaga sp.]|uniref:nuclear transport factor 2 family protein n=1 Tax=uncultured Chitinophaga sp. TaxID=339340 RepID=UPI0025D55F2C|nr:nuclear transport factor 2 family protein [uncultured Chitinophaga sp.]